MIIVRSLSKNMSAQDNYIHKHIYIKLYVIKSTMLCMVIKVHNDTRILL